MLTGVNWIAPHTLPIIRQLIDEGLADFCEIMVDNFIHLPPQQIKEALPGIPIALHIVASRFLEKKPPEIQQLATHLRPWIQALEPLYVSDHLVQFSTTEGKRLPVIAEWDYEHDYTHIKNRVLEWQALLNVPLLFENHASITVRGKNQAAFYQRFMRDTHAGLLFDFSNAYIAEHNRICSTEKWGSLIKQTNHFHVAGFQIDPLSTLALDTHDAPIADAVLAFMQTYSTHMELQENKTIVVEFDANADFENWKREIIKIKKIFCEHKKNEHKTIQRL